MRIISGKARGLKLNSPPGSGQIIRPTSDRCREALFSIIQQHIHDSSILDLFAGTGALGLEAMSRGAREVTFVDKHPLAIKLVKKNIHSYLQCVTPSNSPPPDNIKIEQRDLRRGLGFLDNKPNFTPFSYDIIFIDPPYSKGLATQLLDDLDKSNYLAEDGLLISEESSKEELPKNLQNLRLIDKRQYGDTTFWFYRKIKQ